MLDFKLPPSLDLARISKSFLIRNDRGKYPEKQMQAIPCEINCSAWFVKTGKIVKTKNHAENVFI